MRWLSLASVVALAAAPTVAHAQCDDAARQAAGPHVLAGREAAARGDHLEALAAFERAHEVCGDPWLLPYVVVHNVRAERFVEGLEVASAFDEANVSLPAVPATGDEGVEAQRARQRIAAFQEMQAMRERAERAVAEVRVQTSPTSAVVTVDSVPVEAPGGVLVLRRNASSTVIVRVEADGYVAEERHLRLVPGSSREERFELAAQGSPAPAVEPATVAASSADAEPDGSPLPAVGIAVAATGIVVALLGGLAIADAGSADSELDDQRAEATSRCPMDPRCDEVLEANQDDVDARRRLGVIGLVTGLALAAGGATLFFVGRAGEEPERAPTATRCGVTLGGVTCATSF